ncbi:hypothetical protein PWP93_34710 [Paraburkholderia sp. A1RI-2L]|uniref:hypothetical protein n=1 Tax=Paraburkholderia sp. A1RI-2L TaxID=3028367 RepID=UPI003B7F9602
MIERQLPREQVEVETHDAPHRLEAFADEPLLGRAVHVLDAVARALRALRRACRRGARGLQRGGAGAAGVGFVAVIVIV